MNNHTTNKTTHTIYALRADDENIVMYVGATCASPSTRLSRHVSNSNSFRGVQSPIALWLRGLRLRGKTPIIEVVAICDEHSWQENERFWIDHFRHLNPGLLNVRPGGTRHNGIGREIKYPVSSVLLSPEQRQSIEDIARDTGLSISEIVREALRGFLT